MLDARGVEKIRHTCCPHDNISGRTVFCLPLQFEYTEYILPCSVVGLLLEPSELPGFFKRIGVFRLFTEMEYFLSQGENPSLRPEGYQGTIDRHFEGINKGGRWSQSWTAHMYTISII